MTKRLLLLRHAKALPAERGQADRDRALAARGHRDAALMAPLIAAAAPDAVLCSPARRTRETLASLRLFDPTAANVDFIEDLYHAAGDYIPLIADNAADAECVLVIGHNPTIHATALALAGSGEPDLIAALEEKYPTSALAIITLPGTGWRTLRPGSGTLVAFPTPKDVGGGGED